MLVCVYISFSPSLLEVKSCHFMVCLPISFPCPSLHPSLPPSFLLPPALGKIEDLLADMKMDVTRLPTELSKLSSVSKQLKLDEISTLTKMALRGEVVPASVITQAPPTTSVIADGNSTSSTAASGEKSKPHSSSSQKSSSSLVKKEKPSQEAKWVKLEEKQVVSSSPAQFTTHAYSATPSGSLVPIPSNSGIRLQTPEGLIVAGSTVPYTTLAQTSKPHTVTVGGAGATTAIPASYVKVPAAYVDSGQVYQAATLQLVPVSAGTAQQIMVWPQAAVVQQQPQAKAGGAQQLTVVQGSQLISMVDASNAQGGKGGGGASTASIITID